jgi:hypothetical protein
VIHENGQEQHPGVGLADGMVPKLISDFTILDHDQMSKNTCFAASKLTPCFVRLRCAFCGSQVTQLLWKRGPLGALGRVRWLFRRIVAGGSI